MIEYCTQFAQRAADLVEKAGKNWLPNLATNERSTGADTNATGSESIPRLFDRVPPPTASAAIVFCQESTPFTTSLHLAEDLLSTAKRAVTGKAPTIMWTDITRDGIERPSGRRSVLLPNSRTPIEPSWNVHQLDDSLREVIDALSELNASARREMDRIAGGPDRLEASVMLRDAARRNGLLQDSRAPVRRLFENESFEPEVIADLLSIAEWWK